MARKHHFGATGSGTLPRASSQQDDALGRSEHPLLLESQTLGHGILADLYDIGDIASQMRQARLVLGGLALLGGAAIRDTLCPPVAVHNLPHQDGILRRRGYVHHSLRQVEQSMASVRAIDAHTQFVAGDDPSLAQGCDGRLTTDTEADLQHRAGSSARFG